MILVVSDKEKDTSSTYGMETSKATSDLLRFRASDVVQGRLDALEAAVLAKDFQEFGRITMMDSNQFHAICQDTYPPIFYMNDVSKAIIRLVHVLNEHAGRVVAAYTFDAGPNAVIYTLAEVTETDVAYTTTLLQNLILSPSHLPYSMSLWWWPLWVCTFLPPETPPSTATTTRASAPSCRTRVSYPQTWRTSCGALGAFRRPGT